MKKLLNIALLITISFPQNLLVDTSNMSENEKHLLYNQNDKSPVLACILAVVPSVGHAYLGEWNNRLLKPYYAPWVGTASVMGGINMLEAKISQAEEVIGMILFLGGAGLSFSWYFNQFHDAIYLAKQHNADLYKDIYAKEYPIPFKKSKVQKWIDKENEDN